MTRTRWAMLALMAAIIMFIATLHLMRWARAEPMLRCDTLTVIDGDTLHCNGERIRLHGIDSPDFTCGSRFHCRADKAAAARSRDALRALTQDAEVFCRPIGQDRYGRTVARCYARGVDIGCTMIRQGHAVEVLRFSRGAYEGCR